MASSEKGYLARKAEIAARLPEMGIGAYPREEFELDMRQREARRVQREREAQASERAGVREQLNELTRLSEDSHGGYE